MSYVQDMRTRGGAKSTYSKAVKEKQMQNENSEKAYESLIAEHKIGEQQGLIMKALLKKKNQTSRMLVESTGLERSAVTGRINSLKDRNLVVVTKNDKCPTTGRECEWYTANVLFWM